MQCNSTTSLSTASICLRLLPLSSKSLIIRGPQNGGVPPEALPNLRGNGAYSETDVIKQENGNVLNGVPPIYRSIRDLFKKTPAEAFTYFTGGKVYSFAGEKGLEAAITDIGKELNSQYLLSYNPNNKNEPGFHTIKVVINRPRLDIRTRTRLLVGRRTAVACEFKFSGLESAMLRT